MTHIKFQMQFLPSFLHLFFIYPFPLFMVH